MVCMSFNSGYLECVHITGGGCVVNSERSPKVGRGYRSVTFWQEKVLLPSWVFAWVLAGRAEFGVCRTIWVNDQSSRDTMSKLRQAA